MRSRYSRAALLVVAAVVALALPSGSAAQAPANDNFAAATPITGASVEIQGTTVGASKQTGEPNHGGDPGGTSVWYRWTAVSNSLVTIETCETTPNADTLLGVYTGNEPLATLTQVTGNDEGCNGGSGARVRFLAAAGTIYNIAVDSFSGFGMLPGPFELDLRQAPAPPSNDAFATPELLTGTSDAESTESFGAGKEGGEPNHAGNAGGASVWFEWESPPTGGKFRIGTCNSDLDTLLGVYTGAAVDTLTPVISNDNSPRCADNLRASALNLVVSPSTVYKIAIDGKRGSNLPGGTSTPDEGNAELVIDELDPPPNDDFSTAQVIPGTTATLAGDNIEATLEAGEPAVGAAPGSASVWYSWTAPPGGGPVTVSTCGSDLDTLLGVYTGAAVNALTDVGENDDACLTGSRVSFNAAGSQQYGIKVDGAGLAEGEFTLELKPAPSPPNDNFGSAMALSGPNASSPATNVGAGFEGGEPDHRGDGDGPLATVWFTWTPPAGAEDARVQTCGADAILFPSVYTGAAVNALTPVVGVDDLDALRGCAETGYRVDFDVVPGQQYRIAVEGNPYTATLAEQDEFTIEAKVIDRPDNDDLADATALSGSNLTVDGTTIEATSEVPPNGLDDPQLVTVWYEWTAPTSGDYRIDTCGSAIVNFLAVFTADDADTPGYLELGDRGYCGSIPTPGDGGGKVLLTATAGETYAIQVLGLDEDDDDSTDPVSDAFIGEGPFTIRLDKVIADPGPQPPPAANQAPETKIESISVKPGKKTGTATAAFSGTDDTAGAVTFECSIDGAGFKPCNSPQVFKKLKPGNRKLEVRAIDADGKIDRTPASQAFKVKKKKKKRK